MDKVYDLFTKRVFCFYAIFWCEIIFFTVDNVNNFVYNSFLLNFRDFFCG
jgi:hypothetical protein